MIFLYSSLRFFLVTNYFFWAFWYPLGYVITRYGIKPDPNKLQSIVGIRRTATTTEVQLIIGMFQYYRDMCHWMWYVLDPLKEAASGPKGIKILWNASLKGYFKEIKCMVSAERLLIYPDWKLPFTVHTDASDKQVGAVISQNNKPIAFFLVILSKPQRNYTTTKKKLLVLL